MYEKPGKMTPALVGGLILGLLSSIPIISAGNICCCLWVLLGGAIAAKMLIGRSLYMPVSSGDGAVVGVLAGVFGSIVYLIIGIPISLLAPQIQEGILRQLYTTVDSPEIRQALRQMIEQAQNQSVGERLLYALIGWVVMLVLFIGFGALGGLLGVALFEKRKGQQPQPPPQAPFAPPY